MSQVHVQIFSKAGNHVADVNVDQRDTVVGTALAAYRQAGVSASNHKAFLTFKQTEYRVSAAGVKALNNPFRH